LVSRFAPPELSQPVSACSNRQPRFESIAYGVSAFEFAIGLFAAVQILFGDQSALEPKDFVVEKG
jgi:hypothetical protein